MAGSINKVILVGNLGRDPEVRSMQDGGKIVQLSLATSETWKDRNSGEKKILSCLNFNFMLLVKPTGTVDFITMTIFGLVLIDSLIILSTISVLNCPVLIS